MELFITTNRGLEDVSAAELSKIANINRDDIKIKPFGLLGRIYVKVKSQEDIAKIVYRSRTINRAILLLGCKEVSRAKEGLEEIYKYVKSEIDFSFITKDYSFAVRTERFGVHEYTSIDVSRYVGQAIVDQIQSINGFRPRVDLEEPDIIIRVDIVGDYFFIGIDLVGKNGLHKRGYKVYNHPAALKTTVASQMILLSGWEPEKVLLDPLCGSGTIPIEAAILALDIPGAFWRKHNLKLTELPIFDIDWDKFFEKEDKKIKEDLKLQIYGFDKNIKHVRGAELNSIRAKVRKYIKWGRVDLEWIDVKLEEGSINYIITNPPFGIKSADPEESKKVHKLLFYQADWLLSDNGRIEVITIRPNIVKEAAERYKFELVHERIVYHGNLKASILIYKKGR